MARKRYPCTLKKACFVLYGVKVLGWSQTQAAVELGLNSGTVCHIVHGRRFLDARPRPIPQR